MFPNKKNVLQVVALLHAHGVKHVVLCPGSRNVPLVRTVVDSGLFALHAATDERSAGFYAIGLALHDHTPVAVCCTSGSAVLGLHPAVAEAFYREIPLVVVSADRPAAWIGQMDGQTLPQPGVFGALVRKSVDVAEVRTEEDEWHVGRLVNEALLELNHHGSGPVHINVPLSEPLSENTVETLPAVRRIVRCTLSELSSLQEAEFPRSGRVMVVTGQMDAGEAATVAEALGQCGVAWLTEVLGNAPSGSAAVRGFDALLYAADEPFRHSLRPDLVVTLGGHIVSKRLKQFLRQTPGLRHWHVSPSGGVADVFCHLSAVIEASPAEFCRAWAQLCTSKSSVTYARLWRSGCARLASPVPAYSSLSVVRSLLQGLPCGAVLHLANSSALRLAELFPLPPGVEVHANRGVNGIEGSVSAAVGYAAVSERPNFLLVGDLSFFYDMNALALWAGIGRANLRVVVLNNGGGTIFHTIPGLDLSGPTGRYVTGVHATTAEGWACSQGFAYCRVSCEGDMPAAFCQLFDASARQPVLLEAFTTPEADSVALRTFYRSIKNDCKP